MLKEIVEDFLPSVPSAIPWTIVVLFFFSYQRQLHYKQHPILIYFSLLLCRGGGRSLKVVRHSLPIISPFSFPFLCSLPFLSFPALPSLYPSLLPFAGWTLWIYLPNLKFVAWPVPEIIGGTQKIWAVPGYAHAPFSPKFFMGLCSDGSCEYTCQICSP